MLDIIEDRTAYVVCVAHVSLTHHDCNEPGFPLKANLRLPCNQKLFTKGQCRNRRAEVSLSPPHKFRPFAWPLPAGSFSTPPPLGHWPPSPGAYFSTPLARVLGEPDRHSIRHRGASLGLLARALNRRPPACQRARRARRGARRRSRPLVASPALARRRPRARRLQGPQNPSRRSPPPVSSPLMSLAWTSPLAAGPVRCTPPSLPLEAAAVLARAASPRRPRLLDPPRAATFPLARTTAPSPTLVSAAPSPSASAPSSWPPVAPPSTLQLACETSPPAGVAATASPLSCPTYRATSASRNVAPPAGATATAGRRRPGAAVVHRLLPAAVVSPLGVRYGQGHCSMDFGICRNHFSWDRSALCLELLRRNSAATYRRTASCYQHLVKVKLSSSSRTSGLRTKSQIKCCQLECRGSHLISDKRFIASTCRFSTHADKFETEGAVPSAILRQQVKVMTLAGLLTCIFLITPSADAADALKTCACLLKECRVELVKCIANPSCAANIACLQTCNDRPDETECQIKCGDLFENKVVDEFNECAVSRKKCVPTKTDVGEFPVPDPSALSKSFNLSDFSGKWYITSGLNPTFDTFDCQLHEFHVESGRLVGNISWRIRTPDSGFFTRSTVQRFVQDPLNPAILYNHDNEYLHYQDDWYILSSKVENKDDDYIFVYYRGRNDAWDGYGGAVVYTRSATLPESIIPELEKAAKCVGRDFSKFIRTDNTCGPEPPLVERIEKTVEEGEKTILREVEQIEEEVEKVEETEVTLFQRLITGVKEVMRDAEYFLKGLGKEEMEILDSLKMEANEVEKVFGQALPLRKLR